MFVYHRKPVRIYFRKVNNISCNKPLLGSKRYSAAFPNFFPKFVTFFIFFQMLMAMRLEQGIIKF